MTWARFPAGSAGLQAGARSADTGPRAARMAGDLGKSKTSFRMEADDDAETAEALTAQCG